MKYFSQILFILLSYRTRALKQTILIFITMTRYCSQCGMCGHNKRKSTCCININRQRFNLTLESLRLATTLDAKFDIIDNIIEEFENEIDEAILKYNRTKSMTIVYAKIHTDAVVAHRTAQCTGPMERCVETYRAMQNAEFSNKFARQDFTSAAKIKHNLIETWTKLVEMAESLVREQTREHLREYATRKCTSEYLKEVALVIDLTSYDDQDGCECPLCYDQILNKDAVQTNCSHSYCITCVKNMATSIKDKTIQPSCPLCRTTITEMKSANTDVLIEYKCHLDSF